MWVYCTTLYSVQVNHLSIFTHAAHCLLVCSFVNLHNRSWSQKVLPFSFTTVWIIALPLNFRHACQFWYRNMLGFYWKCIIPKDQSEETDHLNTLIHLFVNMVYPSIYLEHIQFLSSIFYTFQKEKNKFTCEAEAERS